MTRLQVESTLLLLKRAGLMLMMIALPFSNVMMSIATIWMGVIVILEKVIYWRQVNLKKWYSHFALPNDHSVWLIVLYSCSIIGLIYTEDMSHGKWDLRVKLPLLVWPIIFAWIRPLTAAHKKQIWGVFIIAVTVAVFYCIGVYLRLYGKEWQDVRQTSVFISHIRFGMMMAMAVAVVWYYAIKSGWKGKVLFAMIVMLYFSYLVAIESLTGVFLIVAVILWLSLFAVRAWKSVQWRRVVLIGMFALPLVVSVHVLKEASMYFEEPPVPMALLPAKSAGGEYYQKHLDHPLSINGEYVFGKLAPQELHRVWLRRTEIDANEMNQFGFPLYATMIRYLSAKHLSKDSVGVMQLSDSDIQNILKGHPSPQHANHNGLERRLDAIFFEIAHYKAGGDASGHSLTQRWEFWRAAKVIIAAHPWIGVGTGDTKRAFAEAYEEMHSTLLPERRLRTHNQYLTQWLTFGVGGLFVLIALLFCAWSNGRWRSTLWSSFLIIVCMSFITEDTLESQAGVTFVAFFYMWIRPSPKEKLDPQ